MTPRDLTQRRRILFTMLTALTFRYPSGREPALIPALRSWFGGRPGIGRITVGMARQGFDLQAHALTTARAGGRRSSRRAGRTR